MRQLRRDLKTLRIQAWPGLLFLACCCGCGGNAYNAATRTQNGAFSKRSSRQSLQTRSEITEADPNFAPRCNLLPVRKSNTPGTTLSPRNQRALRSPRGALSTVDKDCITPNLRPIRASNGNPKIGGGIPTSQGRGRL